MLKATLSSLRKGKHENEGLVQRKFGGSPGVEQESLKSVDPNINGQIGTMNTLTEEKGSHWFSDTGTYLCENNFKPCREN